MFAGRFSRLSPLWEGTMGEWLIFSVTLMVLIVVTWSVHRWWVQSRQGDDPASVDRDMLTAIRDLKREGDLSDDEYRSIKDQLVDRIAQHEELQSLTQTTDDTSDSGHSDDDDSAPGDEFKE